ncbi:MAG: helix-turn-helix domain-containing protein [Porcipelethomonas sp.]
MAIGKVLSNILKEKNTTVTDLARDIGVAPTTIYSIIDRDNMKIDISILIKICKSLGVDINIFYEDYLNSCGETAFTKKPEENILLTKFNQLNELGQSRLLERLNELLELPKYQKKKELRKISEIMNDHAYIAADEGGVTEIKGEPGLPKISDLIDKKHLK